MKKIILDLCGGTGAWSRPYKENGYDVRVITLPDYDVNETVFSKDSIEFRGRKMMIVAKKMFTEYYLLHLAQCFQ